MLLEGSMSTEADVISGIPQGTVLGPLFFLAFINDLPESTSSDTRLFADDALIYRHIKSNAVQMELDALQNRESIWQMNFHPEKCQVIRICTNKRFQRETTYTLHGHILEAVKLIVPSILESPLVCLFVLRLNVPVNNFSVMSGRSHRFLGN